MCEHLWVSQDEIKKMGLPFCRGDIGPVDFLPIATRQKQPIIGESVCWRCAQIFGIIPDTYNQDILKFVSILTSFNNSEIA